MKQAQRPQKTKKYTKNQKEMMEVLLEFTDGFLMPKIDEMMDEKIFGVEKRVDGLDQRFDSLEKRFDGLEKRFDEMRKDLKHLEHALKSYVDRKSTDTVLEVFKKLDKKYKNDRDFKEKVVELFKKHKIGSETDLAFLEGMVAMS